MEEHNYKIIETQMDEYSKTIQRYTLDALEQFEKQGATIDATFKKYLTTTSNNW